MIRLNSYKFFFARFLRKLNFFCTFVGNFKIYITMAFDPKNYEFSAGEHENEKVIFVRFQYNSLWHKELKTKFPTAKWNPKNKYWYIKDTNTIREEIGMTSRTEAAYRTEAAPKAGTAPKTEAAPRTGTVTKAEAASRTGTVTKAEAASRTGTAIRTGTTTKAEAAPITETASRTGTATITGTAAEAGTAIRTETTVAKTGTVPKTEIGKAVMSKICPVNIAALERMCEQLVLKGYSPNTIKSYSVEFAQLLYLIKEVPVDSLTPERLRAYILYCLNELKLSENTIHSRLNALKFYFEQVLNQDKIFFDSIPRPKKKSQLPEVISKKDIAKIFSCVTNPKHLLMLKLCYGMGLRVSEIVKLKVKNIDSQRMLVHIEAAKGKIDRYVALPTSILDDLRSYYLAMRPKDFLFEGENGGQYSIRSAQLVFQNAKEKAKINKSVGIHGLRHSYATHLLESGTDMVFIQKLLGHKDIKTTEIYARVSTRHIGNIKSPLDDL